MEPRRKPLLALVPRDLLLQKKSEFNKDEFATPPAKNRSPKRDRRHENHEQQEPKDAENSSQQEQRLGERFLRVMALMSRLSHMNLGSSESLRPDSSCSISLSILGPALSPKRSPTGKALVVGASSPVLVRVNAATESLRQHLTTDIVDLLPAPIDARQSPLQSPIRRQQLRRRGKRSRRKRRRRAPIEWHTSHATWAPRASADYIHEHGKRDFLGNCAGLVRKLAELKCTHGDSGPIRRSLVESVSLPMLPDRRLWDGSNRHRQLLDQQDQQEDEESDSASESEREDQEQDQKEQPSPVPAAINHNPEVEKEDTPAPERRPPQPLFHQPAWISPELRRWLLQSRMFPTKT